MIRAEQGRSFQLGKVGNRFRDGRRIKLFLNSGVIGLLEFSEQMSNFDDKAKGARSSRTMAATCPVTTRIYVAIYFGETFS